MIAASGRQAAAPKSEVMEWQSIETAPRDNKRRLFIAYFNEDGSLQSFDYNASWESDQESWEMPITYYYWASENGNVEEPTHWMYQPDWFDTLPKPGAVK